MNSPVYYDIPEKVTECIKGAQRNNDFLQYNVNLSFPNRIEGETSVKGETRTIIISGSVNSVNLFLKDFPSYIDYYNIQS